MYKLLLFLHKSDEEKVLEHFNDYTLKYLSEISGEKVEAATVESSLLLEQKFSKFCEVSVESKEIWDEKMNSDSGRELNKDLMDFHQFITVIFVDYDR
jgi:hypothetical protein